MNLNGIKLDGNLLILITALIGGAIIAIGIYFGTKITDRNSKADYEKKIDALESSLALKNEELKGKQEELNRKQDELKTSQDNTQKLAGKVLQFTEDINQITKATNSISVKINNQLREKGSFTIKLPNVSNYTFVFGSNSTTVLRKTLLNGLSLYEQRGVPILLKLVSDELKISTMIRDDYGNILVHLKESNWALDKSRVFSINFDSNGLEVVNKTGLIVFQMNIVEDQVNIQAIFYKQEGVVFMLDSGTTYYPYSKVEEISNAKSYVYQNVKPIFVHEGDNYIGKRLKADKTVSRLKKAH